METFIPAATPPAATYDHIVFLNELVDFARTVGFLAASFSARDLKTAAETISRAQSIGPILDPTAYQRRLSDGGLEQQQRLVQLVRTIRAELLRLFPNDPFAAALLGETEPVALTPNPAGEK